MSDKWTSASALKEFLRREQDILIMHRMPRDRGMDSQDLSLIVAPGNNGNGEANPGMGMPTGQY